MGGRSKMGGRRGAFAGEVRARDSAIACAIGRVLRAQYDLAEPLPAHLADLIMLIDGANERHNCRSSTQPRCSRNPGARLIP